MRTAARLSNSPVAVAGPVKFITGKSTLKPGRRAADGQSILDEIRDVAQSPGAEQSGRPCAAPAVAPPRPQRRHVREPVQQLPRFAVEVLAQMLGRQHDAQRQALPIGANEAAHVQRRSAAIAQQQIVSDALLPARRETLLDGPAGKSMTC